MKMKGTRGKKDGINLPNRRGLGRVCQMVGPLISPFHNYIISGNRIVYGEKILFLDASTHLYKRLCPSVGWLVGRLVGRSVVIELRMMKMHRILDISQIIASFYKVDAILHHS